MRLADVNKAVGIVAQVALSDNERAHRMEDEMRTAVLKAIANGRCEDPKALARAALKTQIIEFERWYG